MPFAKRIAALAVFASMAYAACALEISGFKPYEDGGLEAEFCGKFKVENISLKSDSSGGGVEMPLDWGGYENLLLTSSVLEGKIEKCLLGECALKAQNCEPKAEIIFSRKVSDKSLLLKVSFDGELTAVFFLGRYKRLGKVYYKLSSASDFEFTDNKYRKSFREFVIKEVKNLL